MERIIYLAKICNLLYAVHKNCVIGLVFNGTPIFLPIS